MNKIERECKKKMSKSIYDEVLDILIDSFFDPQDEDYDCYMLTNNQMMKISKATKLGKLYKELSELIVAVPLFEGSKMICYKTKYRNDVKYTKILNKIKELENERK